MAIPACTAGADQSFAYSVSQAVTLAGAATGSPTAWEWRMLSVPSGSTDNVGTNGSFTNGVATVQNPSFTAHNPGCYVLQLKAQNGMAGVILLSTKKMAKPWSSFGPRS